MDRILCNRHGDLRLRPLDSRDLASGEVRLRLECAAVLPGETFPILRDRVPGRFFCARVEETAPDCTRLFEGDRVTVAPQPVPDVRLGNDVDGCWQEEMIVPEAWAVHLPDTAPVALCALFAPLAAVAELLLTVPAPYGLPLGIYGGDAVGSLALQCARLMGFSPLCVLEASEAYRRRAVSLGADFTLNPANDHALARLLNLTEGGFPVILNCGETEDAAGLTLSGLREGGTALYLKSDDDATPLPSAENRSVRAFAFRDHPLSDAALRCARWMLERQTFSLENLVDREIALSALPGAWEDAKMGLVRGLMLVRPEN